MKEFPKFGQKGIDKKSRSVRAFETPSTPENIEENIISRYLTLARRGDGKELEDALRELGNVASAERVHSDDEVIDSHIAKVNELIAQNRLLRALGMKPLTRAEVMKHI